MAQRCGVTFPGLHSLLTAADGAWISHSFLFSTSLEFGQEALNNCCRFYNNTVCT